MIRFINFNHKNYRYSYIKHPICASYPLIIYEYSIFSLQKVCLCNNTYYQQIINKVQELINIAKNYKSISHKIFIKHIKNFLTNHVEFIKNSNNFFGYVFCNINKCTALNTFIWIPISDT